MSGTGQEEQPGSSFSLIDLWSIALMQRNVVLACTAVAFLGALVFTVLAPRKYRSVAVVHLASTAGQEVRTEKVVDMDQFQRWNRNVIVKTQIDILTSSEVLGEVLDRYAAFGADDGLLHDDAGVAAVRGMVQVAPRQGTELLDISVTSDDPDKSMRLANTVAEVFRDQSLAARVDAALQARTWLEDQILSAETQIEEIGKELRDFQKEHDLADAEDVSVVSQAMGSLKTAYAEANTERVIYEKTVRQHEALSASGAYEQLAKSMDTPLINQLMQVYATAVTEQARLKARYKEKVAERVVADAEVTRIEQELQAEVKRTLGAERAHLAILREREQALQAEIDAGKDDLLVRQGSRVGYDKRKLQFEAARDNYSRLQVRRSELELQAKTQLNNVRVVEAAVANPGAVSPVWSMNLAFGLVGGLLVGLALGFTREWLDDSISSPLEVTTFLRARFLGIVPKIEEVTDPKELAVYTHQNPLSNPAEALRAVRTLLDLLPEGTPKRLLITSAVQGEGKTSTSVHLGVSFASLGKRVVLVDCDLRRPRLHKLFSDDREIGVSSVLRGEKTVDEVLQTTPVPGLTFIASGRSGDRPAELLSSTALAQLLVDLDQRFDLVIVDSPPSAVTSDARILSKHVDGLVFVVRENLASRALIREAVSQLEQVGARVYGVVLNAVDFRRGRTNYKYGYGYRYGYGYGYRYRYTSDGYSYTENSTETAAK